MLVLNHVQILRRKRKSEFWALNALFAALGVGSLFLVAQEGSWKAWLCLLFFGGGGAAWTFLNFQPPKAYKPGLSFRSARTKDSKIVLGYKLLIFVGLALSFIGLALSGTDLLRVLNSDFNASRVLEIVLRILNDHYMQAGIGAAVFGCYGLIAKSAHGNVDAAAVALSQDLGAHGRNAIYLAYANYGAADPQEREGNIIFLVGADRVIICLHDGFDWSSTEKAFEQIYALGIYTKSQGCETRIYLEFADGKSTEIAIDPRFTPTTEPQTFVRSLLELIDQWALGGVTTPEAASRRRVVKDMTSEEDLAPKLLGQARDIAFATPTIEKTFPGFSPASRRLEL